MSEADPTVSSECPDENTIVGMMQAMLSAEELEAVEAHIEQCPRCRELVTMLAQTLAPGPGPIEPGRSRLVGRYEIRKQLAFGGMGVVYEAYDPELRRRIAVKLMRPDLGAGSAAAGRERLLREARALASVSHPNVVAAYDVGSVGDQVFIALELVDGHDVAEWTSARERTWREVVDLYQQAGRGLSAAHGLGVLHRDVKPQNILVGDDGRVRITDFGLATEPVVEPSPDTNDAELVTTVTTHGQLLGTPAYMAPELYDGSRAGELSDQFSFCVALYESLYGRRPFAGENMAELVENMRAGAIESPASSSSVPAQLHRILLCGLSPSPSDRFPSMKSLVAELDAVVGPPRGRRRAAVAVSLGLLAASALVAAIVLWRGSKAQSAGTHPPDGGLVTWIGPGNPLLGTEDGSASLKELERRMLADSDLYKRAQELHDAWEGAACARALAEVAERPESFSNVWLLRLLAECEMQAGDCEGGAERLRNVEGKWSAIPDTDVEFMVKAAKNRNCSTREGPWLQRFNRIAAQFAVTRRKNHARCRKLAREMEKLVPEVGEEMSAHLRKRAEVLVRRAKEQCGFGSDPPP